MAGAKGAERGSLLDSVSLGTSFSSGSTVEWNVTLGVQNAMRENRSVNFLLGILGVGSGQTRDVQLYPGSGAVSTRPELTFVYVPGSNAVPNDPSPMAPLNGSWSIGSGVDLTPLDQPMLEWNFNSNLSVGGYAVQLDTTSTFDSSDLQVFTSWNDAGFDLANNTYTPVNRTRRRHNMALASSCNLRHQPNRKLVQQLPLLVAGPHHLANLPRWFMRCSRVAPP